MTRTLALAGAEVRALPGGAAGRLGLAGAVLLPAAVALAGGGRWWAALAAALAGYALLGARIASRGTEGLEWTFPVGRRRAFLLRLVPWAVAGAVAAAPAVLAGCAAEPYASSSGLVAGVLLGVLLAIGLAETFRGGATADAAVMGGFVPLAFAGFACCASFHPAPLAAFLAVATFAAARPLLAGLPARERHFAMEPWGAADMTALAGQRELPPAIARASAAPSPVSVPEFVRSLPRAVAGTAAGWIGSFVLLFQSSGIAGSLTPELAVFWWILPASAWMDALRSAMARTKPVFDLPVDRSGLFRTAVRGPLLCAVAVLAVTVLLGGLAHPEAMFVQGGRSADESYVRLEVPRFVERADRGAPGSGGSAARARFAPVPGDSREEAAAKVAAFLDFRFGIAARPAEVGALLHGAEAVPEGRWSDAYPAGILRVRDEYAGRMRRAMLLRFAFDALVATALVIALLRLHLGWHGGAIAVRIVVGGAALVVAVVSLSWGDARSETAFRLASDIYRTAGEHAWLVFPLGVALIVFLWRSTARAFARIESAEWEKTWGKNWRKV